MDVDFGAFLTDISNLYQESIDTTKLLEYKEQQQRTLDGYNIVSKHYQDILSEISEYA